MDTNMNRRRLLAAAAIAPAAIMVPACASSFSTVSPNLTGLIAAAVAAEKADADYSRQVFSPAAEAAEKAIAAAEAAYPHVTIEAGPSIGGGEVVWSTSKPTSVAVARSIITMAREGRDMTGAGLAQARKVYAAHLNRTRAIDRVRRANCTKALIDQSDALNDAAAEAADAVCAFPIDTPRDLHIKLAFMAERHMGDGIDWVPVLLADAERIVGRGGRA